MMRFEKERTGSVTDISQIETARSNDLVNRSKDQKIDLQSSGLPPTGFSKTARRYFLM
jgi:hypothetical protein